MDWCWFVPTVCLSVTQCPRVTLYQVFPHCNPSLSQAALFNHLSVHQKHLLSSLAAPRLVFVKACTNSRSASSLSRREEGCLTDRLAFKSHDRGKRQTLLHTQTHTSFPASSHVCLHSQTDLRKLLRQIQRRNSICRGDERSDRVVREERRIKGQEEEQEWQGYCSGATGILPPCSSL